jgi:hypothetical protein
MHAAMMQLDANRRRAVDMLLRRNYGEQTVCAVKIFRFTSQAVPGRLSRYGLSQIMNGLLDLSEWTFSIGLNSSIH